MTFITNTSYLARQLASCTPMIMWFWNPSCQVESPLLLQAYLQLGACFGWAREANVCLKTTMAALQEVSFTAVIASVEGIFHWKKSKEMHWLLLLMENMFLRSSKVDLPTGSATIDLIGWSKTDGSPNQLQIFFVCFFPKIFQGWLPRWLCVTNHLACQVKIPWLSFDFMVPIMYQYAFSKFYSPQMLYTSFISAFFPKILT